MMLLSKLKKNLLILAILTLLSSSCFGQGAAVIRGEVSPGNYVNIKTDGAGNLYTAGITGLIPDPCASSGIAKTSAVVNITTATTTQLVAISGSTTIYVCGFSITVSEVITTPNTIKFVYGTGASCGTGTVNLTGLFGDGGVTAGIPIVIPASAGITNFKTIAGQALCVTTAIGATGSFQGFVTYVQQ